MAESKASSRSRATMKYEAKAGRISKTYKLQKEVVDQFADACKRAGSNQSAELTKFMLSFIEAHKDD